METMCIRLSIFRKAAFVYSEFRKKENPMKVLLVGASGTIGSKVLEMLKKQGAEVITVGKTSGDYQVDIADRAAVKKLFEKVGKIDAVANASGDVAFAPLNELSPEKWNLSLSSKLLGQINLVQEGIPYLNERGSFTLITGIIGDDPIFAGVAAATVGRGLEGFAQAAANELPKNLRINVISPSLLKESLSVYGAFFLGYEAVSGERVAMAYQKSIFGNQTAQIYRIHS
jgi:NAD(P)-dependent dehydrogenase (short-subunit alcohol dehydrogenase family)